MMPHMERLRAGLPPETEIQEAPTAEDRILSRLNKNFRLSKAQQILRLLRDQDDLNQRFRDCALLDEDDGSKNKEPKQEDDDEDAWSMEEEQRSEAGGSDTSENEAERRAALRVALRKHRNSIDPGRCKTSMGFHNQAEVTEIPYDTDSDNVAGLDSAASTPRGGQGDPATALQPVKQNIYGQAHLSKFGHNNKWRVYHPNAHGDNDVKMRELSIAEERMVQSARSSRPKTSLTSSSSARSRYYRQQPHPETPHKSTKHSHHNQNPAHQQTTGFGDTRQSIISRLDPHHPMAVRPFCESRAAQEEAARMGLQQLPSQPSTPRGGTWNQGNVSHTHHAAVTLFDIGPSFSKDTPLRSSSRRAGGAGPTVGRSSSFMDHQRMMPPNRTLLSVDSSPLQLAEVSPRGRISAEDPNSTRRPRSTRVKKRVGEMPRGAVPTSMHVLTDRAPPSLTVMKLPPLETAVSKGSSGRDLVCVGKD